MRKFKLNKLLLLSAVLLTGMAWTVSTAQAQSIRENISNNSPNKATQLKIERPKVQAAGTKKGSEPGYALYRNVIRKDSWLVGQGEPLNQAEADRLPYYFRLSMKNDNGHYQFVEALHGNELTSAHPLTPYILDKNNSRDDDSEQTAKWREKIATVGQWFLTSDLSGENLIEERAYEAKADNANLIYVFQPVKTDDNHAMASYLNDWGLPVDIDESPDHFYGNVVQITYAADGNDSIVDFLDGRGLRRYNEFGVDQILYEFDGKGRPTKFVNRNVVGRPMLDSNNFCGQIFEYEDGSPDYVITMVDRDMNPRAAYSYKYGLTFTRAKVEHDSYGRESGLAILDEDGATDKDGNSVTRLDFKYDDKGNLIK